jgi:putative endonuclease
MFCSYMLLCSDSSLYIGVSDDPVRRPVRLVWSEEHPTLSSTRQRENQIKRWSRKKKLALVEVPLD